MLNASQLINQDSGIVEYYTPQNIIEAARLTMGSIDLDPASSEQANRSIMAKQFYATDGLTRKWFGNVWLNHPFSRQGNKLWPAKLVKEFEAGNILQACCITFAATSESWFQSLIKFPQCFLSPRTNYILPNGKLLPGVTKGSVVTYLGKNVAGFKQNFQSMGTVKVSIDSNRNCL